MLYPDFQRYPSDNNRFRCAGPCRQHRPEIPELSLDTTPAPIPEMSWLFPAIPNPQIEPDLLYAEGLIGSDGGISKDTSRKSVKDFYNTKIELIKQYEQIIRRYFPERRITVRDPRKDQSGSRCWARSSHENSSERRGLWNSRLNPHENKSATQRN